MRKIPGTILLVVLGVVLLVTGILMGFYSEWFQRALTERLVARLNADPAVEAHIGSFRLRFPADISLSDVLMVSHGDTLIMARSLEADVDIKPILEGKVGLRKAVLTDARYQMGALDSAMCMVIEGQKIEVKPSTVGLSPLDIHVSEIYLDSARVNMFINPADTFPVTPPSEPSPLNIRVDKVDFNSLGFRMKLMPTIYDLDTQIASGSIDSISVDVLAQTVDIRNFKGNELNAIYLMPDSAQIANTLVVTKDTPPSAPWTIRIGDISMTHSNALYTTFGLKPLPGLDFEYIQVGDIDLNVHDFYNQASVLRLPFSVSGVERCGLGLDVDGTLAIDSLGLGFEHFSLVTPTGTSLKADGYMGTVTPLTTSTTPLRLATSGRISVADIETMFPTFTPLLEGFRKGTEIVTDIDINGTSGNLNIARADINVDRHIRLAASGNIRNVFEDKGLAGNIRLNGVVSDISHWTADLLAGTGVVIPSLAIKGTASFDASNYAADMTVTTSGGRLALKGDFKGNAEKYDLDLTATDFPVNAFMPKLGIGKVSADVTGHGQGFNFFKRSTTADVNIDIIALEYLDRTYRDVSLGAAVGNDHANIQVESNNPGLDLHLDAEGYIDEGKYVWQIDLKSDNLDLAELGLSETPATVSADVSLKADISPKIRDFDATLTLNSASYNTEDEQLYIDKSRVILSATDTLTNLSAQNRDLFAFYSSPLPLDSIMGRVDLVSSTIDSQFKNHTIDIPELQKAIMPFTLDIEGGNDNVVAQMLAEKDIHFDRLYLLAGNDTSLYLQANLYDLRTPTVKLDSISFDIRQFGDQLDYTAKVNNRPGTFDEWAHVDLNGYFKTGQLGVNLLQRNIKNQVGFDLGLKLTLTPDSTANLHFEPYDPTINYRKWEINPDNFVSYDFRHKHLDANLRMKSDISRLALYTEHANDTIKEVHGADEDLILQLFDIQLQDWIALDPFAPPMKGNLSAGVRLNWEDHALNGRGTIDLTDFTYGKEKVGDFNVDVGLFTDKEGVIRTDVDLWVDGEKTMVLSGILNDSIPTSPFNMDFKMIRLPLSVVNPFLPGIASLSGTLNGEMDIKGNSAQPQIDGYLAFENAAVNVTMLGSTFTLNHDTIPVVDNIVRFEDFKIRGSNENPLVVNGQVDIKSLSSPSFALDLTADNMQIVNTDRARKGAEIYGKAFVGLKASAKGNMRLLNVNADVNLLPGTNVTYVLAGGATAIESQAAGSMVKFVNFADTAAVAAADSIKIEGMLLNLNANLNIQTGTIINVDLGTNVQDRVQLQGSGNFNYVSSPVGDGRLTGRYTFSGGFIKYSPPLISNLNFGFTEGSYVAFSGDLTNPRLNIKAIEQMRANVSQAGQNSRLIYFDIILSVTGTLNNINVAFDLATDDDITVANELASMSPTQRASEAMNLLLYNTYTGGSTKATSNLNGNPLFSFLTNSVNSWLANNVRGVDLSIGVDQYDQTRNGISQTTTSYSYRVSKTLFNDRVKIVVGGSYSDDPTDDGNVADDLINDISVEYYLNNARTMYLKLFRHTGYESILEGEITQTGVGFVYRKKISRVSDMFIPPRWRRRQAQNAKNKEKAAETVDQTKEATVKDEKTPTPENEGK